jgi:hypothetical protein
VFTKDIGQLVDVVQTGCDAYDGEVEFETNHEPPLPINEPDHSRPFETPGPPGLNL